MLPRHHHSGNHSAIDRNGQQRPKDVLVHECTENGAKIAVGDDEKPVAEEEANEPCKAEELPQGHTAKGQEQEEPDEVVSVESVEQEIAVKHIALTNGEQGIGFHFACRQFLRHEAHAEVEDKNHPHSFI